MADRDPFGLWGTAPPSDKYGLWGGDAPRKKRTRSKKPQARDVEQPSSPIREEEDDDNDLMPEPDASPDLSRGPPPGAAGKTELQKGNQREHAWYEPLLESATSAVQGASGNLLDEATAGARWVGDKLGLSHSGNSYEENLALHKADLDRITRDYPYGHGAGQMVTGMAASAAAPGTKLAQGGVQGALSAASEYADSRDPLRAAGAGVVGAASGVGGTWLGGKLAKLGATSREAAQMRELEDIARQARGTPGRPAPSGPDYSPVPEAALAPSDAAPLTAAPQGPPRPLPIERGAPYDPLARSSAPMPEPRPISANGRPPPYDPYAGAAPEVPQAPRPQPNPAEMAYPYDPRAAGASPMPSSGPPRPLPSGSGAPYDPLAAQASPMAPTPAAVASEAAVDDLKDPVVRTALEVFTPTLAKRSTAPELAEWAQKVVEHKLPPAAESALLRAWTKRVKDVLPNVDPERLMTHGASGEADIVEELGPKYALGELNAPKDALPRPRTGEPSGKSSLDYLLGDVDAPTNAISRPRLGGGVEPAPEYRLGDVDAPMGTPSPRVRGGSGPLLPEYALGDVPGAPLDALPRPRTGGTPRDSYALGDLVSEPPAAALPAGPPNYRLGDLSTNPPPRAPSMPAGTERELQEIALKRAAQNAPPDLLGSALGVAKGVVGGRSPTAALALRGAGALNKLRTPGMRELALQSGDLVPNERYGMAGRMASEAAWELGAPAVHGGKVNAQDRDEKVAYADQATVNYALTETLHGGNTGLSQADEQALTSAVVKGDDDAIRATDFRLRQRYPGYARRVERALRNLNEGED
jgi:hypothetical protein